MSNTQNSRKCKTPIQTVYISNSFFKEVIDNSEDSFVHEVIYSIMEDYSNILLDLDDDEFLKLIEENPIYEYFLTKDTGDFTIYKEFFEKIENEDFSTFPTEIFLIDNEILSLKNIDSKKVRDTSGCLFFGSKELSEIESLHKPHGYSFKLKTPNSMPNSMRADSTDESWEQLLSRANINPVNALIIIDSFLKIYFKSSNNDNVFKIIKAIMPKSLEIEFQILFVLDNSENIVNKKNAEAFINDLSTYLIGDLEDSKPEKKISIGITTFVKKAGSSFHERAILTNHHYFYSDRGFDIFKGSQIINETKGRIEWVYQSVLENSGSIRKDDHHDYLFLIKKLINDNKEINRSWEISKIRIKNTPYVTQQSFKFNVGNVDNRLLSGVQLESKVK